VKRIISAEVIQRSFGLGLGENIWYRIDYIDEQGNRLSTVQYGRDIEEACQKKGIDWLS